MQALLQHFPEMPTSGNVKSGDFYDCSGKIIFVSHEIHVKMPQKLNYQQKKNRILEENGKNSKLKHRKAQNAVLTRRFGDLYGRPGELAYV